MSGLQRHESDDLGAARGIVNGLLLSIPIWVVIGLILLALAGCSQPEYGQMDQCLRREIFMQCLAAVKNGARATHKDLGPMVDECAGAASYQSVRREKFIKPECRA